VTDGKNPAGYCHRDYANSLAEFGRPLELPRCCGWLLERPIPAFSAKDAMGCYPLFCCLDWQRLGDDFDQLREELVALSLVADPFGNFTTDMLKRLFDVVLPYKEHFVADLSLPLEQFTSARHRKYGRKVLRNISVEVCSSPAAHLDEWVMLYNHLIERHNITGLRRFSRKSFEQQLSVPGSVLFRATEGSEPLSLDLWYVQGEVAQAHLVGTSPRGYELQVSYGLKLFILEYLTGKVRWANLGGVPGVNVDMDSGLADFKRGWSSETRTAFLCGKIFNQKAYNDLVRSTQCGDIGFFPAYRRGEHP
jgi:hypothetical protein